MVNKILIIGFLLLVTFISCEDNNDTLTGSNQPKILSTRIDSAWNISANEKYIVEVEGDDPQGIADLNKAMLTVLDISESVIFEGELYDNGSPESGDVIANDGIFRNLFFPSQITAINGDYYFRIVLSDQDGNLSNPSQDTVSFKRSSPLILSYASAPDSLLSADKSFYFQVEVQDTTGNAEDIEAWFDLAESNSSTVINSYQLYNDGDVQNHGDDVANDSLFSTIEDTSIGAGKLGWYDLRFQAKNQYNSYSNLVIRKVYIENTVGRIYYSSIPETVEIPNSGEVKFYVKAWITDPQGNTDVDSVYCRIQSSSGSFLSNNNKFMLNDDGQDGDDTIGDGIYTIGFSINSSNNPDEYTFYFNMRDKVGNLSDIWLDYLEIVEGQ